MFCSCHQNINVKVTDPVQICNNIRRIKKICVEKIQISEYHILELGIDEQTQE